VYEGSGGLVGFGRVLRRSVARADCSDLEVFVAYDRDGAFVGAVPLRRHARGGTPVVREEFERWARERDFAACARDPLRAAFQAELDALERELGQREPPGPARAR
jgi:hypothetical protein